MGHAANQMSLRVNRTNQFSCQLYRLSAIEMAGFDVSSDGERFALIDDRRRR